LPGRASGRLGGRRGSLRWRFGQTHGNGCARRPGDRQEDRWRGSPACARPSSGAPNAAAGGCDDGRPKHRGACRRSEQSRCSGQSQPDEPHDPPGGARHHGDGAEDDPVGTDQNRYRPQHTHRTDDRAGGGPPAHHLRGVQERWGCQSPATDVSHYGRRSQSDQALERKAGSAAWSHRPLYTLGPIGFATRTGRSRPSIPMRSQ